MNLPNKLSLLRIIMVPIMAVVYLLDFELSALYAVIIFIFAAFTDFLDGYIARKYNMITDLGKLLDPIADKLLVLCALFLISYSAVLEPDWLCAICGTIIIGRELLISAVRQVAASKGIIIQANIYGKIKTFVQDIALPTCMLLSIEDIIANLSSTLYAIIYYCSLIALLLATILTIISGIVYLVQNKGVFVNEK